MSSSATHIWTTPTLPETTTPRDGSIICTMPWSFAWPSCSARRQWTCGKATSGSACKDFPEEMTDTRAGMLTVAAVATFSDLSLGEPGMYVLLAHSAGSPPKESKPFIVGS